jgi:cell division transport system ATP-binding protein
MPDFSPLDRVVDGPVVRLEAVCAGYRKGANVLQDVYFEAVGREVQVITGPSGAGKTTLINVLRTALLPRAGRLYLFGTDATKISEKARTKFKQRIGFVAQAPVLMDDRTTLDNVALPLSFSGAPPGANVSDVVDLLNYVGLAKEAERPAGELSIGQRRLAAIARALVVRPELVLADEPTAGLAPESAARVLRLLNEVCRMGAAVVMTTQDPNAGAALGASPWRIVHGRLGRPMEAVT